MNNMSNVLKCEGSCEPHTGEVVEVVVSGNGWKDTKFNYCQTAIAEDRRRGFTVTFATPLQPGNGGEEKEKGYEEPLKPEIDKIDPDDLKMLKRLSELTGHSIDAVIAGYWVRNMEVQTLRIENEFKARLLNNAADLSIDQDYELKRLYEWVMDEGRQPAQTFFTASPLRDVAKEIQYRLSKLPSPSSPDVAEDDATGLLQGFINAYEVLNYDINPDLIERTRKYLLSLSSRQVGEAMEEDELWGELIKLLNGYNSENETSQMIFPLLLLKSKFNLTRK